MRCGEGIRFRIAVVLGLVGMLASSCVTPLPLKSSLPGIPVYGAQVLQLSTVRRCAVTLPPRTGAGEPAAGPSVQSSYTVSPEVILGVMSVNLHNMGCEVPWRPEAYITREFRLSLDRLVLPLVVQTRLLRARDGRFADVLMEFVVYDARTSRLVGRTRAWGRSEKNHALAAADAMRNVTTLNEFRDLLTAPSR
ncbi:MAG: hypothetical protein HQ559_07365 [Lentisphaerae bacterium]|nr:hypothetical protein [Lentisphaerota bacterium]